MRPRSARSHYFARVIPSPSRVPTLAAVLIAALSLAGCAAYHPAPLDPLRLESDFRARSLSDPGLRSYLEAGLGPSVAALPDSGWDLEALTLVGFYFNPGLDVARARVGIADAGVETAGARPNPAFGFAPERNADAPSTVSPWTLGLNLDLPLEAPGVRGSRIARARALSEAARLELADSGWAVRSRVRATLLDHLLARRELDLQHGEMNARADNVALMEQRLAVGEISSPQVYEARTALSNGRLSLHAVEGRVRESLTSLAAALGVSTASLDSVRLAWPDFDQPPFGGMISSDTLQTAGLLNRLVVRRGLADYAAVEAALRLEIRRQVPDLRLGPGYTWDQGERKFSLGLSLALPIFDRNRGPISVALARRREAGARFQQVQADVIAETEGALARYRAALAQFGAADTALIELQRGIQRSGERAVRAGAMDRLALAGVRLQVAVAARARLDALRRTQEALGALEDAIQRPLNGEAPTPQASPTSPRAIGRKETAP